jgi:p-aminobenzoyl-glutamate transporter AbgT
MNYWKELSDYINSRKYFILGIVFFAQIILFFLIKAYFFGKIVKTINTQTGSK